ncbi:glucose-1-phosphate cytidylyltransferase [Saccharopolyspora gloriosae]|uniref:glucose-1-phosphate cytidylyltransferase n=1 Tax=Saccharopolyspora gloriosae TaxID=455344 RepID=UPI001FB6AEDE|nr:glucose-1-phosphate cytidylyltransferase [Saccharopolyspora gloriosae]
MNQDLPVIILCGGYGTRIREASERLPKAMVDIGGRPILWHIMKLYGHYGFRRFVLCLGYKGWEVKQFFMDYRTHMSDFTISLSDGHRVEFHNDRADENWEITFAETGLETATGARLRRIRPYVDTSDFMMSYGDGLGNINLKELEKAHRDAGRVGTVTGIHPTSKFGEMEVSGAEVVEFNEKPTQVSGFVSGGFFMFKRDFLEDYLDDDPMLWLESEPLQRLARDNQMTLHPHHDFWHAMDTYKDYQYLNSLWAAGDAPWKIWP